MKLNVQRDIAFGTSLQDIKVPDALRVRVKSGINFVDNAFGGQGLTPSAVTLLTGTPGAGKTTLLLSVANSMTDQGCEVVFNTAEESLFQLKLHAERLRLANHVGLGEISHVPTLLAECDKIRKRLPQKQFVLMIDSLQTLDDGHFADGSTNSMSPVRALQQIIDWAKETNAIVITIGHVNKDGRFNGKNTLKHMVDTFLELSVDEDEKSDTFGLRCFQTSKNRFGGNSAQIQWLAVKDRGFTLVASEQV